MMLTPAPSEAQASQSPQKAPNTTQQEPIERPYPEEPINFGPDVPFSKLAKLFEALSEERKQARKRKLLEKWFNAWRRDVGNDLFPALRLILPQKDRERAVYGLKEKALANVFIKLIPLQKKDPDAQRMLFWKKPTDRYSTSGDFPQTLCEVVQKRSSVLEGTLTIQELNEILERLSKKMGKSDDQAKVLQTVYSKATAEEQKWIIRIILKDMNISVKEKTVFSVFHPDAEDLYNACSDLKRIAWQLTNPNVRLNPESKEVSLFEAFLPMLCQRPKRNLDDVVKEMGGRAFIIEEKLDGERMQLHKRGNEYFYCSRKGKDYTYLYGQTVGTGSLTPYIDDAFHPDVQEIILDGEMLVWDPVSEQHLPFGTLKTFAAQDSEKSASEFRKKFNPRPCFKVFDMLYLNGRCLTSMSVSARKKNMRRAFKEVKGHFEYTIEFEGKNTKDIRMRMDEVMEKRGEGLVVKHPSAKYVLNGRGNDWFKVKPEYMDNLGETVDVLVIAGNYGTGRRSGGVSTFICAVLDDTSDADEPKYSSFVRIGSGFSFADFVWIREKPWKKYDPKHPPKWLQTSKVGQEDKGDLYLEPEDSFIIKVKAAEYVVSEKYHCGWTLRFPRALSIRADLRAEDCMLSSEIPEQIRSRNKRKIEDDQEGGRAKKVRKTTKKTPTISGVSYSGLPLKKVPVLDELFGGYTIAVFRNEDLEKPMDEFSELQRHIKAHGGVPKSTLTTGEPENTFYIYSGSTRYSQVEAVIKKGRFDIVKPNWVLESIEKGEKIPLSKKYFFHATEQRKDSEEYMASEEDDDEGGEDIVVSQAGSPHPEPSHPEPESTVVVKQEIDPELSEWFNIGGGDDGEDMDEDEVSGGDKEVMSDNDSDGDDVERDNDLDEWFQVDEQGVTQTLKDEDERPGMVDEGPIKMGEDEEAMHYDTDKIFKHLCFYLDTPSLAAQNNLTVKSLSAAKLAAISSAFASIQLKVTSNGGKIAETLDDSKLTHIIMHEDDLGRRGELMKRTAKPKHKNMVILQWVEACLDEETLLNEEDFMP